MGYIILGIMFVVFMSIVIILNIKKDDTLYTKEDLDIYKELKSINFSNDDNSNNVQGKEEEKEYVFITSLSDKDSNFPTS